ncbi:MAG: ABC transporter permease [Actinomycetes bacterium]
MNVAARRTPWAVIVLAALGFACIVLPLAGLLRLVSWRDLGTALTSPEATDALRLSLGCSLCATAISVVLGVPLAWVLARLEFPGRRVVRAIVLLPIVLPPVVGGVALFAAFGRHGLVGGVLHDAFGLQFTFSPLGVVLAETFVALPFLVITVEAAIRALDPRLEVAAEELGASRATVIRRVTLPLVAPGIAAGAALAWARALGEFGATITFAGNVAGRTRTAPLAVALLLASDPEVAVALSVVLLAICVTVLVVLRDRWWPGR